MTVLKMTVDQILIIAGIPLIRILVGKLRSNLVGLLNRVTESHVEEADVRVACSGQLEVINLIESSSKIIPRAVFITSTGGDCNGWRSLCNFKL